MGCVDPGQEAGGCVFRPALGFLSHAGRGVPAPRKVADPGLGVDLSLSDAPEVEPFIAGPIKLTSLAPPHPALLFRP
jgi:hypothetical protein